MRISGTGISNPIDIKIKPDFRPLTEIALKWVECDDGNYSATDRGASGDIYEAEFSIYGTESYLIDFYQAIEVNRAAGSNEIVLSEFNDSEKIFGADVDYSSTIAATIIELSGFGQKTWKGFGGRVKIRAISPTFTGSSALPSLRHVDIGYTGDTTFTVTKYDSYSGVYSHTDRANDSSLLTVNLKLSDSDAKSLRRYLATVRGNAFEIDSIYGITYPFGLRGTAFPIAVKCIEFKDNGMVNVGHTTATPDWSITLKLAKENGYIDVNSFQDSFTITNPIYQDQYTLSNIKQDQYSK